MNIGVIFMIWFLGSSILNLLHFHGDGQCYYPVRWSFRIGVSLLALTLWILYLTHIISAEYSLSVVFAWLAFGPTYSIWCRHRGRVARNAKPSA